MKIQVDKVKIKEITGRCSKKGCQKKATTIAGFEPATYCEAHAEEVADQGKPEYTAACPNCGCRFGVN